MTPRELFEWAEKNGVLDNQIYFQNDHSPVSNILEKREGPCVWHCKKRDIFNGVKKEDKTIILL